MDFSQKNACKFGSVLGWCHITNLFVLRIRILWYNYHGKKITMKTQNKFGARLFVYSFQPPTSQANQKIIDLRLLSLPSL